MSLGFFFIFFFFIIRKPLPDHNLIMSQAFGVMFGYLSTIDLHGHSELFFNPRAAPMLLTSN